MKIALFSSLPSSRRGATAASGRRWPSLFLLLLVLLCGGIQMAPKGTTTTGVTFFVAADPPPDPQCRVFCFRVTDIRCDDIVDNRYHVEFEVLNWSNAFAGGVKLQMNTFTDAGISFGNPPALGTGVDPDGRPLFWTDIDNDGNLEGDADDLEDSLVNGNLDIPFLHPHLGEDKNGNGRLDNDPIPGNLRRTNTWELYELTPTTMVWMNDDPLPYINLLEATDCRTCIENLPGRGFEHVKFYSWDPATGEANMTEWVDNGDNVQDGFVVTIDGLSPGRSVHMNWFLMGSGANAPSSIEDASPGGDCRISSIPSKGIDEFIGSASSGGSQYGFGVVSLTRLADPNVLPGGTFQGQTGFRQSKSEFFDSVYNVPDSESNGSCGTFGMEFSPGLTCPATGGQDNCPGDDSAQGILGQNTGLIPPTIDGNAETFPGEWDGASVIPLYQASKDDGTKPSLSTAYVKVNCATNEWFVRTEINQAEGATHMVDSRDDHHVKLGETGQAVGGGKQVDGNSGVTKFRYIKLPDSNTIVGWEAKFTWTGSERPRFIKIHTQVMADFSTDPEGETSASPGTNPNNLHEICVCGGVNDVVDDSDVSCTPIDTNGGGDPHFSTWTGKHYTFHGECDLVLIRNPTFARGLGMHVHGRTKIHDHWSDMESVAIQLGNDVFEARGSHEYWINGEPNATLPALLGGAYQVSLRHFNARRRRALYVISLGGGGGGDDGDGDGDASDGRGTSTSNSPEEIHVKAFKTMMWVQVKGQQSHIFAGSDGLFGHYGTGDMMGRDGRIMNRARKYGQEWQVRPDQDPLLFHNVEGPQYPNQHCKMPSSSSTTTNKPKKLRRGKNKNDDNNDLMDDEGVRQAIAKKACAHAPANVRDDCIYDVVATHNVEVATAY